MAILNILNYPDDRLRIKAKPVEQFDDRLQKQIDDMFETMYAAPGIGLAATQVDFHQRLIVIDVSEDKSQPLVVINPEIIEKDGIQQIDEGCLSVPGIYEPVERAEHIRLKMQDRDGNPVEMEAEGL
ncbi:MAG: peptide deformylase, partial [Thiohalophilus sp.]